MKQRVALLIGMLGLSISVNAEDTMRCGNRLVADGDPKVKVSRLCGQPTSREQRTVLRAGFPRPQVRDVDSRVETISERELALHDRSLVEVEVDVWIYNRGRSRLLREIVFEDNRVIEVNVLGRGF